MEILRKAQVAFLAACLLLAPTSFRWVIWSTADHPAVYTEFESIVLFLPDLALIGLFAVTQFRLWHDDAYRTRFLGHIHWAWLLLPLWMLAGMLWSAYPLLALYHAAHLMLAVILALSIASLDESPAPIFMAAGAFHALIAVAQVIHGDALGLQMLGEIRWPADNLFGLGEPGFRGYGLAVHPNNLAGYLLVCVFCGVLHLRGRDERPWWMITLIGVAVAGLLATRSRAAIGALSVGMLPLLLGRRAVVVTGVSVTVALLVWLALGERLIPVTNPRWLSLRLTYAYAETLAVIQQYPLLGAGPGHLLITAAALFPTTDLLLPAHNTYLMVWGEIGVIGLLLFLLMLGYSRGRLGFLIALLLIMGIDYYFWGDLRSRLILFAALGMIHYDNTTT